MVRRGVCVLGECVDCVHEEIEGSEKEEDSDEGDEGPDLQFCGESVGLSGAISLGFYVDVSVYIHY